MLFIKMCSKDDKGMESLKGIEEGSTREVKPCRIMLYVMQEVCNLIT